MSDSAQRLITIHIAAGPTRPALRPVINGVGHPIPFNVDHEIPETLLAALRDSDVHFEIVSQRDVVAAAGEMSDGADAGGTVGPVATITPEIKEGADEAPIEPVETDETNPKQAEQGADDVEQPADEEKSVAEETPPPDHTELLTLLDKSAPKIAAALPGLSAVELAALLAGETAGKTRTTVVAAINAATAALPATE